MPKLYIFILSLFSALTLHAQEPVIKKVTIKFHVIISKKEPLTGATVGVTNSIDTLERFYAMTDSNGYASFQLQVGRPYEVVATGVGFHPANLKIMAPAAGTTYTMIAKNAATIMEGVTVISKRPIMRQEDDKLIVEPENLAATSTSGYEVIEKVPGLFVDQDGNILINSLTPAAVQINGREMKMSAADMATLLKSLPPNAIGKIEIVRSPSASYDASASGGVVNVVLKKGVKIGMTGSVNAGMQQGNYGNQYAGVSLNNNDGEKSSFVNFNFNNRNSYDQIVTDRAFTTDSLLSQDAATLYHSNVYFAGYGLAGPLSKKWSYDFAGSASLNHFNNDTKNQSDIFDILTPQKLSNNLNTVTNKGNSYYWQNGIEFKYKPDTTGSEWKTDFFYTWMKNTSAQDYVTAFTIPFVRSFSGDGEQDNKRDAITIKSDLKLKKNKKFTLETGFRISASDFRNEAKYFTTSGGTPVVDSGRTNTFHYTENINAIYAQGTRTIGKNFVIKSGFRVENTNMTGTQQVPAYSRFSIHRTDLFPYVYLSNKLMSIAGYELRAYLVYRRTITRPQYEQLNPFARYIDPYMSEKGNPALRPQFTNNYEFNVSVDQTPLLAAGINDTKDIFTNVVYQADSSRSTAYRTYDNLGKNKEWYLRGMGALPPGGKYFFVLGAQYNHNFYQGLYENKPLSFKKGTWTLFTYHTLKLDKLSTLTVNGFVRFKGQQQFYELSSFGSLSSSINRLFLKKKLTVTLSVNDIFLTNRNDFTINQGSIHAAGVRKSDSRRFGLNLRYNFGVKKKEEVSPFNVEAPAS